jgi:hypothetical protein
MRWILKS